MTSYDDVIYTQIDSKQNESVNSWPSSGPQHLRHFRMVIDVAVALSSFDVLRVVGVPPGEIDI